MKSLLEKDYIILDGAMGTEIQKRGLKLGGIPEVLNMTAKDMIEEILSNINETADNCIMVGNDADEDMIVKEALGIETYMITNCLLNKSNKPIDADFVGTMQDLITYVKGL